MGSSCVQPQLNNQSQGKTQTYKNPLGKNPNQKKNPEQLSEFKIKEAQQNSKMNAKNLEDRKRKYEREYAIAKDKGDNCRESNPKQAQKHYKQAVKIKKTIDKFDKRINKLNDQARRLDEHNMDTQVISRLESGQKIMNNVQEQRQKLQDIKLRQADIKRQRQQISEMLDSSEDEQVDEQVQKMMNPNKNPNQNKNKTNNYNSNQQKKLSNNVKQKKQKAYC